MRKLVSSFLSFFVALFIAVGCAGVLLTAPPSQAEPLQLDKIAHASVSATLGSTARLLVDDPWKAWAIAMAPGVVKELYDARRGGTGFGVGDLAADALGAFIGVKVGGLAIKRRQLIYSRKF